jgi:hypothetical protein
MDVRLSQGQGLCDVGAVLIGMVPLVYLLSAFASGLTPGSW